MNDVVAPTLNSSALAFLAGGGEMGQRMRRFDWGAHVLGSPEQWPQSLKTIVRVMLDSRYAMWMAWGPHLTFFCNDAYLPTVGIKRDWVLGARSDEVWKEIWPDVGPRIQHVLKSGEATWDEGLLLFLERSGFSEETYHTFSYSPVYDDLSRIAGMLCVVTEVSERVIGERRLRVLQDLAAQAVGVEDVDDSCARAMQVLARYPLDLPFAALYLIEPDANRARRAAVSRTLPDELFPSTFALPPTDDRWKLAQLGAAESRRCIEDLSQVGLRVPATPFPEPVQRAVVLSMRKAGQDRLVGFLIAGVSPRRAFDDAYSSFLDLVAGQLASTIANAQAYEAERERAEALAEIDRAKTTFFSNVSHEFRTPLTLMLAPIEELVADTTLSPPVRTRLELLHRNAMRLLKLVNSLLEFSRIEAGRVAATYAPTDLSALTRDLVSTFRSAVEAAGLQLRVEFQPLTGPVYVDRDMWEKIVLNLLSNAFKFTFAGEIEVRLSQSSTHAVLIVRDTGIGIPEAAVPKLFERFYRVEGVEGRTHEGSGIGLALVHELIKLHSGSIRVESQLGQGTTLVVELPLGSAHLPANRIGPAQQLRSPAQVARQYVEESLRWLPDAATPAALPRAREEIGNDVRGREVQGARIIVADDNSDMRAYLRELLETRYAVELVPDGQAALEAARRRKPDLIVSDVMMPRLDGFGLLRTLRADPGLHEIPVILLSARAGEESVIEGLDALADDYLTKPFSARELLARVGAQLQFARLREHAQQALRRRTAQFETLLNEAPLGVYLIDADFRIRDVNPTALPVFGNLPNLIGRDFAEVIHILWPQLYADEVVRLFRETLETGRPYATPERIEERRDRKVTEYYEWQISRIPLPDERFGVVCYFRDISAHVRARIALETADQQKNEFLAMLAHELRNPLAPIRNAGELLSRTLSAESSAQAAVAIVKRQVGQLTRLVDDLLDVSRITQGRVELQRQPLELGSIISQAVETVEPLFQSKGHTVTILSSYQSLHLSGDPVRLVQCVVNILTNAAKYTDAGGTIRVETRLEGAEAVATISDTGVGISAELLPRIFDLFVQAERTLDRSLGGLGIGLSVARRLIEMHGGRLSAQSPGLGQGSTFEIRLPLLQRLPQRAAETPRPKASPCRIFIVDDNKDAANSLSLVLQLDGHITEAAYSAREALERAALFGPDVILLDIGLPELDGYEVATRLRALAHFERVHLIALTGYGQAEDIRRAREVGFDDHLIKPVDFAALERALAAAQSRRA